MNKRRIFLIFVFSAIILFLFTACSSKKPIDRFNSYIKAWEDKDYEAMYSMLSQESKEYIEKDEFLSRYRNIYDGIAAKDIEVDVKEVQDDGEYIEFSVSMDTLAGPITQNDYQVEMIKEEQAGRSNWYVKWDESLIFPQMEKEDKVRVVFNKGKRGEIFDRFGKGLAINGTRYSLGIHPAKYDESNTPHLANILDIDEEIIDSELEKNTNPEHFVPIVKLSMDDTELLDRATEIEGVIYQEVKERVYPGGEALGSLIGYIRPITKEELDKDTSGVYTSTSLIGRQGLEEVYEEVLRPTDGVEIYISKLKNGVEMERFVLAKTEPIDGQDLHVTIDTELQKKIYEEMDGDIGASTAIDPKTGEVLAMVSSPSFDSNLYTSYIPNSQRKIWEEMDVNVFENRFNKSYSPGSTFKMLTAAIGLEEGVIDPDEKIHIEGKGWQKNSSWGNYRVNRVNQNITDVDLNDAIVYSDNIYFAKKALDIGGEALIKGVERFGFNQDIPIKYPMAKSQLVGENKFDNEILLADTGYGQGEVLMSPLHLTMVYSSLVNDGDIMEPILEKGEETRIWKEMVVSEDTRKILLDYLVNVIDHNEGTGHEAKLENIRLAGKTGTAELKASQEGRGQENGWFVAMDAEEGKMVISMLIEQVETRGGSKYILPKVRNIMKFYLEGDN